MSFETILESIVRDGIGVLSIALMETDGIPIAQVDAKGGSAGLAKSGSDPMRGDITAAGVEFGRIVGDIAKASDALGGGEVKETVVSLARFTLIFHPVDDEVLLVLALHPDGNLGKARYLIRRNVLAIRQEL
jgi:predicted regulator of Ras-like GTPase activity (Roadblock/LC7/MglB family)